MNFGFIKDRYDYELLRREHLTEAVSLPVGVLSILGGAIVAMVRSFSYDHAILTWAFGVVVSIDVVAFLLCLIDLGRSYHRQEYLYLPLLGEMEAARRQFFEYAQEMAGALTAAAGVPYLVDQVRY